MFVFMPPKIISPSLGIHGLWFGGDIGLEKKFFMMVRITGSWSNTVKLVCRLWAGELPETGQCVDADWLAGCELAMLHPLTHVSHPRHVGHESTSLPWGIVGVSGIIYVQCLAQNLAILFYCCFPGAPSFPLAKESTGCSGKSPLNPRSKVPSSNPMILPLCSFCDAGQVS